jgi:[ribosomal protein S5]-alanine N-acetyltransferase
MPTLTTDRLTLREFTPDDAPFVLELLNDEDFIRFIGDRSVRTHDDARAYIVNGPVKSYATNGFGLYRVALRVGDTPIGMCGLIRRPGLPEPDIGFAFLAAQRAHGYATEAATAVLDYARTALGITRVLGITTRDNERSGNVLRKIGLRNAGEVVLPDSDETLTLYAADLAPG